MPVVARLRTQYSLSERAGWDQGSRHGLPASFGTIEQLWHLGGCHVHQMAVLSPLSCFTGGGGVGSPSGTWPLVHALSVMVGLLITSCDYT